MAAFGAAALLAVNVLAVGVTAGRIARRLPDAGERLELLLLGLLCVLVEIVAVLTVLGLAHGIEAASVTAAHLALGTVTVAVAIAGLRPSDRPTLVDVARRMIGRPGAAVDVVNVFDTRQLFGPRLDVPLNAVGYGPVGRQMPIQDAAALTRAVEAQAPVVVAVSADGVPDIRPIGWRPPPLWRLVGIQRDAEVFVVQRPG